MLGFRELVFVTLTTAIVVGGSLLSKGKIKAKNP